MPLPFLMSPRTTGATRSSCDGSAAQFLSMPWRHGPTAATYFIWGATAAMLRNLYRFLRPT